MLFLVERVVYSRICYHCALPEEFLMNFARPVFLVQANLVFVGIRYKHLGYKASPYTRAEAVPPVCASRSSSQKALSARTFTQFPIPDNFLHLVGTSGAERYQCVSRYPPHIYIYPSISPLARPLHPTFHPKLSNFTQSKPQWRLGRRMLTSSSPI